MIEKIIVVAPTTAVPMSTGLAVALNVLPSRVVRLEVVLAHLEVGREAEITLDLLHGSPESVPSELARRSTGRCQ
jgi:hypothetical protein